MDATLHLPLNKALKTKAELRAKKQGYSSLQEVLRVFIAGYASGNIVSTFQTTAPSTEYLTPELELELGNIEDELMEEIKNGTAVSASSFDEMMDILVNKKRSK